jgi:curli biogenesis system outer membrane secretion channel CsgG
MKRDVLVVGCAAFFATGCAVVPEQDVVDARQGPQVSHTLRDSKERFLKRKVAIARFSNETQYGRSVLLDDVNQSGDVIGKRASDILSTRLGETEKFLLFERIDGEKLWDEAQKGNLDAKQVPVDYMIFGSIGEFGRETVGETGVFSRTKTQKAHARVSLRLVDVRTSRVIYTEEGSGEALSEVGTVMGVGTQSGYDSSLNDKAISAAISKLVSNLLENLLEQPWQSSIVEKEADAVFIAGGKSQGLRVGDTLVVYERGKLVKNPQTGGSLELPGKKVGTIEVVDLFGTDPLQEGARCQVKSGELPDVPLQKLLVKEK